MIIVRFSLPVQIKIYSEPVSHSAEQHKEVPDEMSAFLFHGKRNDPEGIEKAAGEDKKEQGQIVVHHFRQEHQAASSEDDIQRDMDLPGFPRPENADQCDAGQDHSPFGNAEGDTGRSAPVQQPHRRKGTADQQVDGDIVKPPPQAFHRGAPLESVVQAAHQEHQDEAAPVDQRRAKLHPRIGPEQQQHQARQLQVQRPTRCRC